MRLGCGRIARLGVVGAACLALAACSAVPSSRLSQRTYGDGEPILCIMGLGTELRLMRGAVDRELRSVAR